LIGAHPEITCPGETFLLRAASRFLKSDTVWDGLDYGVLGGLQAAGFAEPIVLERLREFVTGFHAEFAAKQGVRRWMEKTAVDAFHIDNIGRILGDHAYFICVTRHALDVVCSLGELTEANDAFVEEFHQYIVRYPRPTEAYAHAWADSTNSILNFAQNHPDNACVVKYEELVAEPETVAKAIVEFVGEEWTDDLMSTAMGVPDHIGLGDWKTYARGKVDAESVERWKTLTADTISRLGAIVNPTLERAGYEAVPLNDPKSYADAMRRHEMGMMVRSTQST
jgi:protein-tyrosine sulfotransferase